MTADKQAAISAIGAFVDDYVESYVLDDDECYHEPTEHERFLIEDAINGLVANDKFEELMAAPITAERDALRALTSMLRAELQSTKDALRAEVESQHQALISTAVARDDAREEVERLRAEVESLTQQLKAGESFHAVAVQQRDAAWREVEALRADAERYRWMLINATNIDIGPGYAVLYTMRGGWHTASLTAAIDAARAAQGDKT